MMTLGIMGTYRNLAYKGGLGEDPQQRPRANTVRGTPEAESFEAFAHRKVQKFAVNMPRPNMALVVSKQMQPPPVDPRW